MRLWSQLADRNPRVVIGLMSGTSGDGLDMAACRIQTRGQSFRVETLATSYAPFPASIRERVLSVAEDGRVGKRELIELDHELARFYAGQVIRFRSRHRLASVDLIGSHGQTIFHMDRRSSGRSPRDSLTWQIGSGDILAARTGVPVVSDFRIKDIAVGGSGAPLTPICHHYLFSQSRQNVAVLNLGGISNLTYLPAGGGPGRIQASDCGPGNMLVDALMDRLFGRRFDRGGRVACSGEVHAALLRQLCRSTWFSRPFPRSLGREQFGQRTIDRIIAYGRSREISQADLVATVSELTVAAVMKYLERFPPPNKLLLGGGGAHNYYFRRRFAALLSLCEVISSSRLGVHPDFVEAVSFALLAVLFVEQKPGNLPAVTGAVRPAILGRLSLP